MRNVMVDLETLGRQAGCVILSIGAVEFDINNYELKSTFYEVVNTDNCVECGLSIDPDTLAWWSKQSEESRSVIKAAALPVEEFGPVTLENALSNFTAYLRSLGGKRSVSIWGNGADFDNAILSYCYASINKDYPIEFWNNRCFRTLKNLYPQIKADPREGTYHNALDDARYQAHHALKIFDSMNNT